MAKRQTTTKINPSTKDRIFKKSLELSAIEGKRISMKDVLDRTFNNENVLKELELGSKQRRFGLRK